MEKKLYSLADRIKQLRTRAGLTQSDIARTLGISRSGVNAWEMGLTVPSTQYIVELAKTLCVSTDYLLGLDDTAAIPVNGLTHKQVCALLNTIDCFRNPKE